MILITQILNVMINSNQNLTLATITGRLSFEDTFINKMNKVMKDYESISYKKGQILFNEGNLPRGVYFVESGIVKIYKYGIDGKEQIIKLAKYGDMIGYKSILTNDRYNVSAAILEEAQLTFVPREDFLELFRNDEEISEKVTQLLCADLAEVEKKMVAMAYKPVRGRLAETLLSLDQVYENPKQPKGSVIKIKLSREDLANLIGTAKETVIRLLSEFKAENLISTEGRIIKIIDAPGLLRIHNLYR